MNSCKGIIYFRLVKLGQLNPQVFPHFEVKTDVNKRVTKCPFIAVWAGVTGFELTTTSAIHRLKMRRSPRASPTITLC